jgi:prepilin-type N-terminal cleavage/methylation domain-containing protein
MFLRRRFFQGFSLMEVLVVLGLFVVVAGLGYQYLRADPNRASAIGLAEELAQELRGARDEAIAEQEPVGIVFPTNSGAVYICKGLYVLRGEDVPRVSRSLRFDSEYGDTAVFVGRWPTPDVDPPVLRADGDAFDVPDWLGTISDPAIVFLPSGAVLSSMPSYQGRYGMLVSTRFKVTGDTVQSAHRAETVWVNALGEVLVETGSPPSVADSDSGDTTGAALPPPRQTAGPDAPVITQVRCEPDFSDGIYPPGVWGGLRQGEYTTLIVEATDPNGGPLYTEWTGAGQFSSPNEGRMEWDEDDSVWRSAWTWSPPDGPDVPGTVYDLSCRVRDPQGNETPSDPALSPSFALSSKTILAVHDGESSGKYYVLLLTEEGHVTHKIPVTGQSPSPVTLSKDGTKFLVYDYALAGDAVVFYRSNGEKMPVLFPGRHASFNVAENEIVTSGPAPARYVEWCEPTSGPRQRIDTPLHTLRYPIKHGDAIIAKTATSASVTALVHLSTTDADPYAQMLIIDTFGSTDTKPCFNPAGSWIFYPVAGTLRAIPNPPFTVAGGVRTPEPTRTLTSPPNIGESVIFSPSGDEVLLFVKNGSNQELWRATIDDPSNPTALIGAEKVSQRDFYSLSTGLGWFEP